MKQNVDLHASEIKRRYGIHANETTFTVDQNNDTEINNKSLSRRLQQ